LKTIADLVELLRHGSRPVVTFKDRIEDSESYAEPGMRARVMSAKGPDSDSVLSIEFDFDAFDEHNRLFERANYYDKHGVPRLTAREAGQYKGRDSIYFELDQLLDGLMIVEAESQVALFEEFKAAGEGTYVSWLEAQVLRMRAG